MDEKEYEHRLTAVESRCKSNSHRLDTVEAELKENTELIVSIKELALETKHLREDLNETIQRLDKLESKDGYKWSKFKGLIVTGLVTLILGYLAASIGLK